MKNNWQKVKIKNICDVFRGGSPRPIESFITENDDGLNWLRIGDIDVGDKYIYRTSQKIKKEGLSKTTLVNIGDFILSNSMSYGRPYIMKITACIHDGWLALQNIKSGIAIRNFLFYLLTSENMQKTFSSLCAGSGVKNLKKELVQNIYVNLPSIEEQERIVRVLECWDGYLEKLGRKIEVKKNIKKALMQKLLTGDKRLAGFGDRWTEKRLGEFIKENTSKTKVNNQFQILTSSRKGIFLQQDYFKKQVASDDNVGYKIIKNGEFTYRTMTDDDKFVFNRLFNFEIGIVSPAYSVFRAVNADPYYLFLILNTVEMENKILGYSQGGTRKSLKFKSLAKIKYKIPELNEQKAIAEILTKADDEITALEKKKEIVEAQKKFLLNNLVTGKILT